MRGHLAGRTISFADAEPFEGGPAASASAVTAAEEVRELADGHGLNEQGVSESVRAKEVPGHDQERFGKHLIGSVATVHCPEARNPQ